MKNTLHLFLVSALLISTYLNNSVQAQEITGMEIFPEYPTNADEILLIVNTSFPFLDCRLDSIHPFYACGAFSYDAFYGTGFTSGYCERTDTISLGTLDNGLYIMSYRMYYLGWSQVGQIDTSVSVGTTGIPGFDTEEDQSLSIWPNPSNGTIHISAHGEAIDEIRLNNASGTYARSLELQSVQEEKEYTLYLPPGLYICTAISGGHPVSTSKFIVLSD